MLENGLIKSFMNYFGEILDKFRRYFKYTVNQIQDTYRVLVYKNEYIVNELTNDALTSEKGYRKVDLGAIGLRLATILVVTYEGYLKKAIDHGVFLRTRPEKFDPKARIPFEPVERIVGETIANINDERYIAMRHTLKVHINRQDNIERSNELVKSMFSNWSSRRSINEQVRLCVMNMISHMFYGVSNLPVESETLLTQAEHALIHSDTIPDSEINKLKTAMQEASDNIIDNSYDVIEKGKHIFHDMMPNMTKEKLKKIVPLGATLAEGNLSTLLTSTIILLSQHLKIKDTIAQELKQNLKKSTAEKKDIKDLPYLDAFYKECLRYVAPALLVVRYASKRGVISDVKKNKPDIIVEPRTYIIIPLRNILHAENLWDKPSEFNPNRFTTTDSELKQTQYPFLPFSIGMRSCPASASMVEQVFKSMVCDLIQDYNFSVDKTLETVKVGTIAPRLKKDYYLTLNHKTHVLDNEKKEVIFSEVITSPDEVSTKTPFTELATSTKRTDKNKIR